MLRDPNKLFSPEEFKGIFSKVPRLCVELVIKMESGIVLGLRSLPTWHNQWHLPGATVFYHENIEMTARRIAKNEVGLEIEIIKTLGYLEYPSEQKERGFGNSISIVLLAKAVNGYPTPNEDTFEIKTFRELPENIITEQREFLLKHWSEVF